MATQTTNYVTGDAAFAVNRQGVIVLWNSPAETLFGYRTNTALGQRCWKLLSGKDIYGNRYCCEHCPLREMAIQHESVHGFQVSFKTASEGRKRFAISFLEVFDRSKNELLLHICHAADEAHEHHENIHSPHRLSEHAHGGALTKRELEALALLADGKTTREISSIMYVSPATARNHIQHTLDKLHVHNRLEAVVIGQRIGLI